MSNTDYSFTRLKVGWYLDCEILEVTLLRHSGIELGVEGTAEEDGADGPLGWALVADVQALADRDDDSAWLEGAGEYLDNGVRKGRDERGMGSTYGLL